MIAANSTPLSGILSSPLRYLQEIVHPPLVHLFEAIKCVSGIHLGIELVALDEHEAEPNGGTCENAYAEFLVPGLAKFYCTADLDGREDVHCESLLSALHEIVGEFIDANFTRPIVIVNGLHEVMISLLSSNGHLDYLSSSLPLSGSARTEGSLEPLQKTISIAREQHLLGVAMTRNMLEFLSPSQKRLGKLDIMPRINFVELVEKAMGAWQREAERKGVEMRLSISAGLFHVRGNALLLQHMISNILSNAIKYSYSTSRLGRSRFISITLRSHDPGFRDSRLRMSVSNYGLGLEHEEQDRVGNLGFRGEAAMREQPLGFGVGVYVARQIASSHGGTINYTWRELHDAEVRGTSDREEKTYLVICDIVLPLVKG